MKRILVLALAMLMCLGALASCGAAFAVELILRYIL